MGGISSEIIGNVHISYDSLVKDARKKHSEIDQSKETLVYLEFNDIDVPSYGTFTNVELEEPEEPDPTDVDFPDITDRIIKFISNDDEFSEQLRNHLELSEDQFDYYLDNVVGSENVIPDTDR